MRRNIAIAVGLIAGLAVCLAAAASQSHALLAFAQALEPAGTIFVNLVKMIVIPLVTTTLFVGVARLGDLRQLGRLGAVTLSFFWSTTLIAIMTGMALMRLALPIIPLAAPGTAVEPAVDKMPGILGFLISLVPANVVEAAVNGALLPLIVFTLFFAIAAGSIRNERKARLIALAEAAAEALIHLVNWILWTAPIGVFALAASVTAKSGWSMLQSLALFVATVIAGLILFYFAVYVPAVAILARVAPRAYLKACIGPDRDGDVDDEFGGDASRAVRRRCRAWRLRAGVELRALAWCGDQSHGECALSGRDDHFPGRDVRRDHSRPPAHWRRVCDDAALDDGCGRAQRRGHGARAGARIARNSRERSRHPARSRPPS